MSRVLVVGIGSPFDADTLGWQVVEQLEIALRRRERPRANIELRREDRPGLRLIELIRPYDHVILVDAIVSDVGPGTLFHVQDDALRDFRPSPSTHAAGIPEALALGAALGDLPARVELMGLAVEPQRPVSPDGVAKLAGAVLSRLELVQG